MSPKSKEKGPQRQKPAWPAFTAVTKYRSQKALTFDGLTDWMAVIIGLGADTFIIHRNDPVTVSVWVKNTKAAAAFEQVIIGRWFPFQLFAVNEGGWRIYIWDVPGPPVPVPRALVMHACTHLASGFWIYSQVPFPLDTWVHVVLTYDGSNNINNFKMYWDGVQQPVHVILGAWFSNAINSNAYSHLLWGCQYTAWDPRGAMPDWPPIITYHFEGILDETAVYRHELTATEVLQLYHQGRPQSPMHVGLPAGKHCQSHWRMGEFSDGLPVWLIRICWSQYPTSPPLGLQRTAWWNNPLAIRITEDTPP